MSDLPHPIACPQCGDTPNVQGLATGPAVRWCRCAGCGEVWPWAMDR